MSSIFEYARDTQISRYMSGSPGRVVEEVTDKKVISEVSMGLLNLLLEGNQLGAYRSVYH